ncbi:class I SAM-dependent rRNA methyltransferase [Candidatus Fermentibacteria bacterium]|nr:class I SAM-dependent rRNA methyltransferase [Candidatus Fermentibacteria bacterium]
MSDRVRESDGVLRLHPMKAAAVRHGHPWVFAGAITEVEGSPVSGDIVSVLSADGTFIAWAAFSAQSQIRARCISRGTDEYPDEAIFRERLQRAWSLRQRLGLCASGGVRVVNAEGDGLPGLVLDLYDETASVQFHHPWVERYREVVCSFALESLAASTVVDRSQRAARAREGLGQSQEVIAGSYDSHPRIVEHDVVYVVDARNGQKTGFYLDQRVNRALVSEWAQGRCMLDLYAHTGGFGLAALGRGAAHVTFVESGSATIDLLHQNLSSNSVGPGRSTVVRAEVDAFLATATDRYDIIVMDPPPMARRKVNVAAALRGLSWQLGASVRVAAPNCLLAIFSCSHHLGTAELERLVAGVSLEKGRMIRVLRELSADADHPSVPAHPEGRYLTGILAEVE